MTMPRRPTQPRGIALLLVIALLGAATIMAYAMLSTSALQAQAASNTTYVAQADALAESGINLACYYLQRPERAPVLSSGVYPGQTNVSFGAQAGGTVNITVSRFDQNGTLLPAYTYLITAAAFSGPNGNVQRTLQARVYVDARYEVRHALATATDFRAPDALLAGPTIIVRDDGSYNRPSDLALVRTDGDLTVDRASNVDGKVTAVSVSSTVSSANLLPLPSYPARATPTRSGEAQLNILKDVPHYWYNGQRYTMDRLASNPSNTTINTLDPSANPLNVWYADTHRTFGGNVTLNGTLVIVGNNTFDMTINGRTIINAKNDPTTGRPALPALIVERDLIFSSTGKRLEVTGLVWIGRDVRQSGLVNPLNPTNATEIKGALMFAGSPSRVDASYTGEFEVRYLRSAVQDLWDLCDVDRIPQSVKVVSWGQ